MSRSLINIPIVISSNQITRNLSIPMIVLESVQQHLFARLYIEKYDRYERHILMECAVVEAI